MNKLRVSGLALAVALALVVWWLVRHDSLSSSHSSTTSAAEPASGSSSSGEETATSANPDRQAPVPGAPRETTGTPQVARGSASEAPQVENLDARLDRICATFLTDNPDVNALVRLWDEVARQAELDLESVKRDGSSLSGKLSLPGTALKADFQVINGGYRVSLDTGASAIEGGRFLMRTVSLSFRDDAGLAADGGTSVQFHPDTRKSAAAELAGESERLLGWSIGLEDGQMKATPITARVADKGSGWSVGRSTTRPKIDVTSGVDGKAEQRLMDQIGAAQER
jgi:hypothetical protein